MWVFLLVIFLPLLEIAGFIIIGGKIGIGLSLLWVIADVIAGYLLLCNIGAATLRKAQQSARTDVYPFEEMFDGFCIIAGALLLIFPGFISDFFALPLLIPPLRHWLFVWLKYKHQNIFNDLSQQSRGFTYWYYEERTGHSTKTIEGEYRNTDENKKIH
jgi:UPF0716 protein FxsA